MMNQAKPMEGGYQSRVRSSNFQLARWNGAWIAATALMTFGPKFLWNKALVFTLLAAALNMAIGIGLILATKRYIAQLDELQRRIHLEALAITVGVALIVSIPWTVLHIYGVVPFQANAAHLAILMSLTFLASYLYGMRRYR